MGYIDLSEEHFGRLVVIGDSGVRKSGSVVWKCRCDCGNIAFVTTRHLKSGNTSSCGCLRKESIKKIDGLKEDLVGKRFGRLEVVRDSGNRKNKSIVWECKCDCGNTALVTTHHLKSGNTTSCGCLWKELKGVKDIVGKHFGKLVIVKDSGIRRNGNVVWECQCDCGNNVLATTHDLKSGIAVSCGCSVVENYKLRNLVGCRFGRLEVVRDSGERNNGSVVWECKCDCGKITFVTTRNLKSGNTTSCGCIRSKKRAQMQLTNAQQHLEAFIK